MEKLYLIGNAHLDPVWFWPWQEGYQEVKATFLSALDRMEENDRFIFTCACADYYRWVEENDPDLFARVKQRVKEGRWVLAGGMWVQPDMNVPSAESFCRHFLLSQRYFTEKFGRAARVGYNVDSFGHSAMTPQLLCKSGIRHYVWMRPGAHENSRIPKGPMLWQSPDGSCVTSYRIEGEYYGDYHLDQKMDTLLAFARGLGHSAMCFYGIGNHGGGPTIRNLQEIEKYMAQSPDGRHVCYASPDDYFAALEKELQNLPLWKEELQHHASGCYSTHSRSKHKHRMAENALVTAEKMGVLSAVLTGFCPRDAFMRQAWQNLLFNEFHDAMGGCSAPDVMDQVVVQLDEALSVAAREQNAALQRISWQVDTSAGLPRPVRNKEGEIFLWHDRELGTPVVVFNPHPFPVTSPVTLRRPMQYARDDRGNAVPCQLVRAGRTNMEDKWDSLFLASVPPMGWKLYWAFLDKKEEIVSPLSVSQTHLENEHIRAEFDEKGRLSGLIDKASGLNVLRAPVALRLCDISHCDTWAHMEFTFDKWAGEFEPDGVRVTEQGPARAAVCVSYRYGQSTARMTYSLLHGADQLDISLRLDMREQFRMVKFCLPTVFESGKDFSEIPGGVIARSASMEEECCQRYICMQGDAGGLALLNTGKYSYSAKDGVLCQTLCNTSLFADHYGQNHRDEGLEHMDMGIQHMAFALRPYGGTWQTQQLHNRAALLHQPLISVAETYHKGQFSGEYSGLSISHPNLMLHAFKESEDKKGHILRIGEMTGDPAETVVQIPLLDRSIPLSFTPFELKTLYIPRDDAQCVRECLITESDEVI